jgi:hypothetical protein
MKLPNSHEQNFKGKVKRRKPIRCPRNFNPKVVAFSSIALGFIALTFLINPYFIIGAVLFMLLGQRELGRKSRGQ